MNVAEIGPDNSQKCARNVCSKCQSKASEGRVNILLRYHNDRRHADNHCRDQVETC